MTPVSAGLPPCVEVRGLCKRFGTVHALSDVSVRFNPGRVHALLGENGAGKSTLVKCMMGYYRAEQGTILVDGAAHHMRSPQHSREFGLGMVYQHFTLVPQMTVAENLVLGRPDLPAMIDWKSEHAALRRFMSGMPFQLDPERLVATLAAGEKQKLEILKQLYLGRRFLVLDEPTSVLTPGEADQVLSEMRRLADSKSLTVVLITHKFREVTQFADDVSVMRGGRMLMTAQVAATSAEELATVDVRAEREPRAARRDSAGTGYGGCLLRCPRPERDRRPRHIGGRRYVIRDSQRRDSGYRRRFRQRPEAARGSAGGATRAGQRFDPVAGQPYRRSRSEMHRYGVFLLTEEPLLNGCVRSMSVMANLALRRYDQPPIAWHGWLRRRVLRRWAEELIDRYRIRSVVAARADRQSLGRQRAADGTGARAFGRRPVAGAAKSMLRPGCRRGIEIRRQIGAARNRGVAVLLVSEDLDEVLELSDRVLVMSGGRIVYEVDRRHRRSLRDRPAHGALRADGSSMIHSRWWSEADAYCAAT